jgi:UDP-galactopyranose mutase
MGGYTRMFANMLDHENIRVETEVDFFDHRRELERAAAQLVYSGKIDEFYDYRFGELDYRSLRFQTEQKPGDFQGASIVNYTAADVPYTRIVEHKHFALQQSDRTVVTYEFPQKYERGREPFYPIRDWRNTNVYERYRQLSQTGRVVFGGRLGSYQYFDMHQVVGQAMAAAKRELSEGRQTTARAA